jgi:chorismate-pyruvate lyase
VFLASVFMTTSPPGDPVTIPAAAILLKDLCDRLLAGPSATAVLEHWCRARGLAQESGLVARAIPAPEHPASPAQRERLAVAREAPLRYRRVRLTCGALVLSEAENWYVPSRLTPAMNALLETSEVPFGRVVHALSPSRRNLSLRLLPAADAPDKADLIEPLFAIEALLLRADGLPLCEVGEVYTGAVLAGA